MPTPDAQRAERAVLQAALGQGYLSTARLSELQREQRALRAQGRDPGLLPLLQRGLSPEQVEALRAVYRDALGRAHLVSPPPTVAELEVRRTEGLATTSPHAPEPAPGLLPRAGVRIGSYELVGELARGGMGVVFEARHVGLERRVALKLLLSGLAASADEVERFKVEARAVARLTHPNVVAVHDIGHDQGFWYLAMDFVGGGSLQARLAREGPLPPRDAARLALRLAGALDAVHAAGVLHRDVKPHNVLLDAARGEPVLTDFGLARLGHGSGATATGDVLGTPAYAAPEQVSGEVRRVDARSDVYGLGATLYAMLTGRPPFTGTTALNVIHAVLHKDVAPPSRAGAVPRPLEVICLKCLARAPAERYPTSAALAADLERFLAGAAIAGRAPRRRGRRRALDFALAGGALGIVGLVAAALLAGAGAGGARDGSAVAAVGSAHDEPSRTTDGAANQDASGGEDILGHVADATKALAQGDTEGAEVLLGEVAAMRALGPDAPGHAPALWARVLALRIELAAELLRREELEGLDRALAALRLELERLAAARALPPEAFRALHERAAALAKAREDLDVVLVAEREASAALAALDGPAALAAARRALARAPDHARARLLEAQALDVEGDFDGARERLTALAARPGPPDVRYEAHLLLAVLDPMFAREAADARRAQLERLEGASAIAPERHEAPVRTAVAIVFDVGQVRHVEALVRRAVGAAPRAVEVLRVQGLLWRERGLPIDAGRPTDPQAFVKAERHFEEALAEDPEDAETYALLAWLYRDLGRGEEAARAYTRSWELYAARRSRASHFARQAREARRRGDLTRSATLARRALSEEPRQPLALAEQGIGQYELGPRRLPAERAQAEHLLGLALGNMAWALHVNPCAEAAARLLTEALLRFEVAKDASFLPWLSRRPQLPEEAYLYPLHAAGYLRRGMPERAQALLAGDAVPPEVDDLPHTREVRALIARELQGSD